MEGGFWEKVKAERKWVPTKTVREVLGCPPRVLKQNGHVELFWTEEGVGRFCLPTVTQWWEAVRGSQSHLRTVFPDLGVMADGYGSVCFGDMPLGLVTEEFAEPV